MNTENLDQVKAHHITQLAFQAKCSKDYVRKIINGNRKADSIKAKAILAAAEVLNAEIIKANEKSKKQFLIIGEDDKEKIIN